MPQGDKSSDTDQQKRKARHIEDAREFAVPALRVVEPHATRPWPRPATA